MVLTDAQGAELEALVEACRPPPRCRPSTFAARWRRSLALHERGEVALHPRRTRPLVEGGADLHPLGALGRVGPRLGRAQARGVELGMAVLDGTSIRTHAKAAGASKKGTSQRRRRR